MSDENFLRILPYRKRGIVSIGLIRLKPGFDPIQVRSQIAAALPKDVLVMTHKELVDKELSYWTRNTPVGFVFKLGLIMGLIVGVIIVYQVLYTDVSDHIGEYATLKAMGYRDRYLFSVVIQESIILSVFGFIPGIGLSQLLYSFAAARDSSSDPSHRLAQCGRLCSDPVYVHLFGRAGHAKAHPRRPGGDLLDPVRATSEGG